MPQKQERTESVTVKFPVSLADRLRKQAVKNHQSVSQLLRYYAERGLNADDYADRVDPIREFIRQEVDAAVKIQSNRLAALLNRMTIVSASGYYATIATIAALIDRDKFSSFAKIERLARRRGLEYANSKKSDGIDAFMDDDKLQEAVRQISGGQEPKKPKHRELSYEDIVSGNIDFNNFNFDDD